MVSRLILATLAWAAVAAAETPGRLEMKPGSIMLDGPPAVETQRGVVIRHRAGAMRVLSAVAGDPLITLDLREQLPDEMYVVTATLPAGYRTPESGEQVQITLQTDLPDRPLIHIPVYVSPPRNRNDMGWLVKPKSLIGSAWQAVTIDRLDAPGQLQVEPSPEHITVVLFTASWCGHCFVHVPVLETIWKDYAGQGVQFLGVAGGWGDARDIIDAAEAWNMDWPYGADRGRRIARQLGVEAYPVIFLVGKGGTIEAVHGRWNNRMNDNGLDHLDMQLRTELDTLLAGRSRLEFPDWEKVLNPPTTRPAAADLRRPAHPAWKLAHGAGPVRCKPGSRAVFKSIVQNEGLKRLALGKIDAADGVAVKPGHISDIPPGGLAVLQFEMVAPHEPGSFIRAVHIQTDDPHHPVAEIPLAGEVFGRSAALGG
jgi:hypothetical protein